MSPNCRCLNIHDVGVSSDPYGVHLAHDNGLDRLLELDRRYLKGNLAIAALVALVSPFYVADNGWAIVLWSCVPIVSGTAGLVVLRRVMGLTGWYVLHLVALCASVVGAAVATGGIESPIFQLIPVAGLLWVTYFPEDRASLLAAPVMASGLIVASSISDSSIAGITVLNAATTVVASILIPLFALRLVESELLYRRRAVVDQLTGCLNRYALASRTTELQAQLELSDETVGVVVFDIDHFKQINDTHGHAFGDQTLVAIAHAARQQLRRFELFYRIGGEEFVVLLAGADEQESLALADVLRDAVRTITVGDAPVTISCGVTIASRELDLDQALQLADKAMYTAKKNGRDRTVMLDGHSRGGAAAEK